MNKSCTGLQVKWPLFLSHFTETWIFWRDFRKILKHQLSLPCSGSRVAPWGWADGQTDRQT